MGLQHLYQKNVNEQWAIEHVDHIALVDLHVRKAIHGVEKRLKSP